MGHKYDRGGGGVEESPNLCDVIYLECFFSFFGTALRALFPPVVLMVAICGNFTLKNDSSIILKIRIGSFGT